MAAIDVTCGKGARSKSSYSLCSALCPPSKIWEAPPTNTTTLVSKSYIAPYLYTTQTDQEKRTGGLSITQDACLALPWIPQSSWFLEHVAISFARRFHERSKASVLQLIMWNYASSQTLSLLHCSSIANIMALHTLGRTAVFHSMAQLHLRHRCWEPLSRCRQTLEGTGKRKAPAGAPQHLTQPKPNQQPRARGFSALSPGLLTQWGTSSP